MTGSRRCQSTSDILVFLVGQAPQASSLRVVSFPGIGRLTFLNRSIGLVRSFQRKRPKIKQIGRFQSVYLAQSVHAPITP